jgi:hypothetical protein
MEGERAGATDTQDGVPQRSTPEGLVLRSSLFAPLVLALAVLPATAEDNYTSLDEVDDGHMESLDSVDDGHTEGLDSVDDGATESLNSVDTGRTESLDSVDTGRMESLDEVDTGRTYGLDQAKFGTIPDRSGPVPEAEFASPLPDIWERRVSLAHREVARAGKRYQEADTAHITMRHTGYPTGDARVEIEQEYFAAESALKDANTRYLELVERARHAEGQAPAAAHRSLP